MALAFILSVNCICGAADIREADPSGKSVHYVTNIAQFRTLTGEDYLGSCDFRLTGSVTLVDTNRDLLVLQDATGAVALNFRLQGTGLEVGQKVTLKGTNCCPYYATFPDYPYRPSGRNICPSFKAPVNWGIYYLTRMRGYLHPLVSGNYRFWIASDNSSELWLSSDATPSKARKIASIQRFEYVNPDEWSRYPSQRSEVIQLKGGETYYIEALQEQSEGGDNLSVGWQDLTRGKQNISVIDGRHLSPVADEGDMTSTNATNGILREYWTNFSAGDLSGMGGARPFNSALTVKEVGVEIHGHEPLPHPEQIALNQALQDKDNYRWVEVEGFAKFKASDGNVTFLELSDGQAQVQVRASNVSPAILESSSNTALRVDGVCEGVFDQKRAGIPEIIWASTENSISKIESGKLTSPGPAKSATALTGGTIDPAMQGFYSTRGVVTFNDRVFGNDYVFVQEENSAMLVSPGNQALKGRLKVGQNVDLGGNLEAGKTYPILTPLVVTELGMHIMPPAIIPNLSSPFSGNMEGRWCELEGIVHSANSNGTLSIMGKDGPAYLWMGQTPSNCLSRWVDAKVRARGVLMLSLLDAPLLLVPSRNYLDTEEAAPENVYKVPRSPIASVLSKENQSQPSHRMRVAGEVTYLGTHSFFMQDASGGISVRTPQQANINLGETVDVVAFPMSDGLAHFLSDPLVHPAKLLEHVKPADLDLSEALMAKQSGMLVQASGVLLTQKTNGLNQVLELQEQQRIFVATLPLHWGALPNFLIGSRLRITGLREDEIAALQSADEKSPTAQLLTPLNILLRSPHDVTVLSGPPWWTWRRIAMLVGILLLTLFVTTLWIHLLQRRLERQKVAQIAFSRQVLERLEDERGRIASNLHDSLGQTLLFIKHRADLAIQRSTEEEALRKRLNEISGTTSQAIDEVRRITVGLRPFQLDRLGLTKAIRASVAQISENSSIEFASRVEEIDGLFSKDAEIHIYRIVQEAINNIVKHSLATETAVVVKKKGDVVSLSIRDNGRGFDSTKPTAQLYDLGYGLHGIAERAQILGAELSIDSKPGGGTVLTVEIPFTNAKICNKT